MFQKIKNIYHLFIAILANLRFGFPSRKIRIIGVTGTDGKTTTASMIYHILKSAGKKTAMITTVGVYIGDKVYDVGLHVTTPSSFSLQKYIKKAVDENNEYLVLEVTSHGLDQNRVYGINFLIGLITNVSHEHLDYHRNYEKYLETKAELIRLSNIGILNKDDKSYPALSKIEPKDKKIVTYGLNRNANINPYEFPFETNLTGEFNKYNCLAAISVAKELGIDGQIIREALKTFRPPLGRQEVIYENGFKVVVDFAHTPNAFEQILSSYKNINGRIIHVFGSAGKRDRSKRPIMGSISSKYSDIIVLTAEDPRGESLDLINKEIIEGFDTKFEIGEYGKYSDSGRKKIYFTIDDRKEAIKFAVSIAKKGDLVILTGKSHEKSMNYGNEEVPWDEFKAAENAIELRNEK